MGFFLLPHVSRKGPNPPKAGDALMVGQEGNAPVDRVTGTGYPYLFISMNLNQKEGQTNGYSSDHQPGRLYSPDF
jgi:hypothetical protein